MRHFLFFLLPRWQICLAFSLLIACKPHAIPEAKDTPKATSIEATTTQSHAADTFLILPGDYAQQTTVADLEARFGAVNVRRETGARPSVTIFPSDPTRRAYVFFHDAEVLKDLASIMVNDPVSRWRGKHGVHVGMTLAKLEELNGKPFFLNGFDAQNRARIHDSWSPAIGDDATLGALDVTEGEHLYFEVELGISDPARVKNPLPTEYQLSSDDPRLLKIKDLIQVTGISASSSLDDEWD